MSEAQPNSSQRRTLPALVEASRAMAAEVHPVQAVWRLIAALRQDLGVDRAGVFAYDATRRSLDRVTGVSAEGQPEFEPLAFALDTTHGPMADVARRTLSHYFSNRLREEYPQNTWPPRMTAHGVVPIIAGDQLLGTLNIDNALTGRPLPAEILPALFLYAGLAALPLLALYQQRERARIEEYRRRVMRDMIQAVTNGKVLLLAREEIGREWPRMGRCTEIRRVDDVPPWRDLVREAGEAAGMEPGRAKDLELCAAEAASNALFHGNGGRAAIKARGDRVRVRVADTGAGIDPHRLPEMTTVACASTKDSAGLGYTLMTDLADCVYLYTGPDGTDLIIEMCVEPQLHIPSGWADLV
jgi:anti-sigma regulatory factor (Ser/Thr protein kinase)